jgi:RNA polymerase sigma-70 factor (ECF subfamily)
MRQELLLIERMTGAPASDAELVSASLSAGGAEAFCELVRRHKGLVMGKILTMVRDFHTAEDLAQETFVRAYKSLPQLKEADGFAGWLAAIAGNLAKTALSARKSVSLDAPAGGSEEAGRDAFSPADKSAGPHETASRQDLYKKVLSAIENLPEEYKATVYLKYLKELTCAEIARIQGTNIGTVTSRLTRATAILRERLAPVLRGGYPV